MKKLLTLMTLLMAFAINGFAQDDTWTVAGTAAALNGTEDWAPANADNDMTLMGEEYVLTVENCTLEKGVTYQYKVVKNHAWDEAYPKSNKTFNVDETAVYTVTYKFDPTTYEVAEEVTKTGAAGEISHVYSIAGSPESIFGASWSETATATEMALADGLYTWTSEEVELAANTKIEFKVVVDHSWGTSYPANNYVLNIEDAGKYTIAISFNEKTKEVNATATKKVEIPNIPGLFIVGDFVGTWATDGNWPPAGRMGIEAIEDGKGIVWKTTIENFVAEAKKYEYKAVEYKAEDGWGSYQLPAEGNQDFVFGTEEYPAGTYKLTFTAYIKTNTLTLEVEKVAAPEPVEQDFSVTFATDKGWEKVFAYTWTEGEADQNAAWPGVEITETLKDGIYTYAFKATAAPAKIIFNNGLDGDAKEQTDDLAFENGKAYEFNKPAEPVYVDIIVNGDMEGESTECFYVTEQGIGGPFLAEITEGIGVDGSKAVKVESYYDPAQDWDSQFFVRLPYQLPAGTPFKVSFDYKADKAGDFDTQAHTEPGGYIHWAAIGSGSFTTEWKTFEAEGTVSADMSKEGQIFQTIAFNLAKNKVATQFVFDNVKFMIPSDVLATLTKNPATDPKPYTKPVFNSMAIAGDFLGLATEENPEANWDLANAWQMTQSEENPAVWTLTVEKFAAEAKTYEYKAAANGSWDGYKLPNEGNADYNFNTENLGAGNYSLTFTVDTRKHSLNLDVKKLDVTTYTATFTTNAEWENVYAYAWSGDGETATKFLGDWPGTKLEAVDGVYTVSIETTDAPEKIIFNNGNTGEGNQTGDLEFVNGGAYEFKAATGEDDPELEAPEGWVSAITNGNLAGEDASSFVMKEYPSTDVVAATIEAGAGKNGSSGVIVKAGDDTTNENYAAWDSQFWIVLNEAIPAGTKLHVEFDYKASKAAKASTQAHGNPGAYQHWSMIGDVNFTEEWQHFSKDIEVDEAMAKGDNGNGDGTGLLSIAFNLQEEKSAVDYRFDNFGVWYKKPVEINSMAIVGDFTGGWPTKNEETGEEDWSMAQAMTQDAENPAIWTLTVPFTAEAQKYEYKAAANGNWKDYVLPAGDNADFVFGTDEYPAGDYNLTFTANTAENTLDLVVKPSSIKTFTATFTTNAYYWEKVYAYAWTTTGEGEEAVTTKFLGEWPGTELTADAEGVYTVSVEGEEAPAKIIFNNGNDGEANQTADLDFAEGQAYKFVFTPTFDFENNNGEWAEGATFVEPVTMGDITLTGTEKVSVTNSLLKFTGTTAAITLAAPKGKVISKIEFKAMKSADKLDLTPSVGEVTLIKAIEEGENTNSFWAWTGTAAEVGFTCATKARNIGFINVTVEDAKAEDIDITVDEGDIAAALEAAKAKVALVGDITVRLNKDAAYTVGATLTAPNNFYLYGNDATITVAEEMTDNFITLDGTEAFAMKDAETASDHKLIKNVEVRGVTVKGLKAALVKDNQKTYVENLVIDYANIEMPASNKNVLDFNGKGYAGKVTVTNSTIWANGKNTGFFAQYGSRPKNINGEWLQEFEFVSNTIVNIANGKNFCDLKQNGTAQNVYTLKNNIFVDCGKQGQTVVGFNKGQASATPQWDVEDNYFEWGGACVNAAEITKAGTITTGEGDEAVTESIVKNCIEGIMVFADAENGDFNGVFRLAEGAVSAAAIGAPAWTITFKEFVAITSMAIVGDFTGGWPVQNEETGEFDWSVAKAMTQDAENAAIWTLTLKGVNIEGKKYEYKAAANNSWDGYQLPAKGNADFVFGTDAYPAGEYNLTFTVNTDENKLTLDVQAVTHTWNFAKWSESTITNLKADAATSKLEGWSDVEKKADAEADADPTELSKDNCFWYVGGEAYPTANGEAIPELKGLEFNTSYGAARSLAIAVNYPETSLGTYKGGSYLWLGGKGKDCFTIKNVKVGSTLTIGAESHKPADARGVQLKINGENFGDAFTPNTFAENSWTITAEEGVEFVDVVVSNTNGCHIYYIDAEVVETTAADGYYVVSATGNWTPTEADVLVANPEAEGEYMLTRDMVANDEIKVVKVENNVISTWYPEGVGNNWVITEDANYTVYFRPAGNTEWENGFFFVAKNDPTGIAAIKALQENGTAVYNINGQRVNVTRKGLYIVNGRKVVVK